MNPTTKGPSRPADRIETHFEEAGSLKPPKLIGRIVRLLLGVLLLWAAYRLILDAIYPMLVQGQGWTASSPPRVWLFWVFVAWAFYTTPYVINIGFTKNWHRGPQWVMAGAAALLLAVDLLIYGVWWAGPLAVFVYLWLTYFAAHLGASCVLSSMLATPGCEMRAMPHLWTLVTGRATKEHYCPGLLDRLDRWEDKVRS
jgi:hypothetical protein